MGPPLAPEHLLERKNLWKFVLAEGKIIVGVTTRFCGSYDSFLWQLRVVFVGLLGRICGSYESYS